MKKSIKNFLYSMLMGVFISCLISTFALAYNEEEIIVNNEIKDINNLNSIAIDTFSREYTGQEIKQSITIKDNQYTLLEGNDYIVEYENNINAGIATVTITGIGNYNGIITKTFNINQKDILNITEINVDTEDKLYIGREIETSIVIKDGEYILVEGTDYIVEYSSNIDIGLAMVTITGTGNYKGSITKFFEIIHNDNFFSGGTGTIEDPYLISTPIQLYAIKDDLTASYKLINDIDLTYDTTNESGLFYNDGAGWISIGGTDGVFSGTLDGNNKKIIGFNQKKEQTTDNVYSCGIFVNSSATIKNLTLEEMNIIYDCNYKKSYPYYTGANIGTISAYFTGKLENVVTSGNIKINKKDGSDDLYADVGGLVGVLGNGYIKNCKSFVSIETNCLENVGVGGIAGTINDSTIEMTENKGDLINGCVGGIANSISNSELKRVKNYGTIKAIRGRWNSI